MRHHAPTGTEPGDVPGAFEHKAPANAPVLAGAGSGGRSSRSAACHPDWTRPRKQSRYRPGGGAAQTSRCAVLDRLVRPCADLGRGRQLNTLFGQAMRFPARDLLQRRVGSSYELDFCGRTARAGFGAGRFLATGPTAPRLALPPPRLSPTLIFSSVAARAHRCGAANLKSSEDILNVVGVGG